MDKETQLEVRGFKTGRVETISATQLENGLGKPLIFGWFWIRFRRLICPHTSLQVGRREASGGMIDTHCHIDLYDTPLEVATATEKLGVKTVDVTYLSSHFVQACTRITTNVVVLSEKQKIAA